MSDKLKSLPPPLAGKRVSVSISRYNEEMEDLVERRERELKIRTLASQEGRAVEGEDVRWNDDDWPDRGEMFERIGTFSQVRRRATRRGSALPSSTTPHRSRRKRTERSRTV